MKTFERSAALSASPEQVLRVLTDPDFEIAQQALQPSTKGSEVVEVSRSDERLVYELRCTEYGRTAMGGIDRSATRPSTTRTEWDLRAGVARWTYEMSGEYASRMRIWGESRVEPAGDQTRCTFQFNAEVRKGILTTVFRTFLCRPTMTWY